MRAPTRFAPVALALGLCAASTAARAQPAPAAASAPSAAQTREARELFEMGISHADAERWGEAVQFFQRSYAAVPRPSTQINLGNALVRAGRAVEAEEVLGAVLAASTGRADAARAAPRRA